MAGRGALSAKISFWNNLIFQDDMTDDLIRDWYRVLAAPET
jgi:hypothetical protein